MKAPTRLDRATITPVRWPLRRPFVTALGRKTHTDNVLVRLVLSGGVEGWGEASSSLAMPEQTGPALAAALGRLAARFRGRDIREAPAWVDESWRAEPRWPTAVGAFESALWDALARFEGQTCADLWGGRLRAAETVLTVPAWAPFSVGASARRAARAGWRFLKLKLNGRETIALNRERLRAARRAAPRARLLVDPNQSFTPDSLAELHAGLRRDGIPLEAVEEPFGKRDWAALSMARRRGLGPFLLDETIQNTADARRATRAGLARGPNIKLAKSGLLRSRAILDVFDGRRSTGTRCMIGCMAESRIGLAAAVHFALGTGAFDYLDLDSDLILRPTPARGGYVRRGPWVSLPRRSRPGLGILC